MDSGRYIKLKSKRHLKFEDYFKNNFQKYCAFAYKFLFDKDKTEDIVQESLLLIWENKEKVYDSEIALNAYIYKVVRSKCINYLSKKKLETKFDQESFDRIKADDYLEKAVIKEEAEHIIYSAMKELTSQNRKIIQMHLDGLKNSEIADELNISVNTVKSHKNTAFNILKKLLKPQIFNLLMTIRSVNTTLRFDLGLKS
ncbi:MAG: sigma-70 family RNA polymerase sigma factor [Marinifilaceae bacterium]|jgi:RNA polymerase sigma-70 factor (ECF subfamily)|nr:sigma-70 family RNA polymerase sigma factor [Marinifilaceae bacterium]